MSIHIRCISYIDVTLLNAASIGTGCSIFLVTGIGTGISVYILDMINQLFIDEGCEETYGSSLGQRYS